jgi:hypothetical protein
MSTTVNGTVYLDILFNEIISDGLSGGNIPTRFSESLDLATGTSDNQINVAWAKREAGIAASTVTVYDLVGSLTNTEGTTITFDEVVLVAIKNRSSASANYIEVGPDATNGFGVLASNVGFWKDVSDRNIIAADGGSWLVFHTKAGVPVVGGSTDELAVITPSGSASNTWDVLVLGRKNP